MTSSFCVRAQLALGLVAVVTLAARAGAEPFPPELVDFVPYADNPVFAGRGGDHWDAKIRERGWILHEGDTYHLWFTGYREPRGQDIMKLGYATSGDGLHWTRHAGNPIYQDHWVEDMMVVRHGGRYYMFAEGLHDVAHLLTSDDRVHWTRVGELDIRLRDGTSRIPGPYGTPTVWVEGGLWYLFYERRDEGIWLATSPDRCIWTNVQDQPVLARGPDSYDRRAVALNQIIEYQGRYYGYYHASDPAQPRQWTTNVAMSTDLIHWEKYPGNPILRENKSSGILVHDGVQFRLYTMHPRVQVHFPRGTKGGR